MVWGASSSSTKPYLVLIPPNKRTTKDFVKIAYESALKHFYYHHDNYQDLLSMEDGTHVH